MNSKVKFQIRCCLNSDSSQLKKLFVECNDYNFCEECPSYSYGSCYGYCSYRLLAKALKRGESS